MKDREKVYYNPKLFRRRASSGGGSRNFYLALALICVGLLGAAYEWTNRLIELTSESKIISEVLRTTDPKTKICTSGVYVVDEDVENYLRMSEEFLREAEAWERSPGQTKTDRVKGFNLLVNQASQLTTFYNEKIVRCFTSQVKADAVAKRAVVIHKTIERFRGLI